MSVAVTGATGLVGTALTQRLASAGHRVVRLVRPATARRPPGEEPIRWDPDFGTIQASRLDGVDAVVHLAGESVAAGRWTEARKQRIRSSRVRSTAFLADTLAQLRHPPRVLVAASAVGYYGDRADQMLTEDSAAGTGFLADVCRDWEAAAEPAARRRMRVVQLRLGMVQAPPSRTVHHVSALEVSADLEVRSSLIVAEWRAGDSRWFAARVLHRLRRAPEGLRIVLKRVDLTDGEAPHRALAIPL